MQQYSIVPIRQEGLIMTNENGELSNDGITPRTFKFFTDAINYSFKILGHDKVNIIKIKE